MNNITKPERAQITLYLSVLKTKSPAIWNHVVRVAKASARVAYRLNKDTKAAYLGGLFHDIGKICLDSELFSGRNITKPEYEIVKSHAVLGATILKDLHLFTSLVAGFHHNMYKAGYGLLIDQIPKSLSPATVKKLLDIATIVSICDFIEAYTTRTTIMIDQPRKPLWNMLLDKYPDDWTVLYIAMDVFGQKIC